MTRILFINTKKAQCSIWNSGLMSYQALKLSSHYEIDYTEISERDCAIPVNYDVFLFNYHPITMRWLDIKCIKYLTGLKFTIVLEVLPNNPFPMCPRTLFDGYLALDPTLRCNDKRVFPFSRPLEMYEPRTAYASPLVPIIGSFGFGANGKGFEQIVEAVNREFDEAVIRINIPHGTYVANNRNYERHLKKVMNACHIRAKEGIKLLFTHDYMTKQELVDWCAENTLNCFLYTRNVPGLAATPDQAILAARPLAVSPNATFRHITNYIRPYPKWSLCESIEKSMLGIAQMKSDWAPIKFAECFEQMLAAYQIPSAIPPQQGFFYLKRENYFRLKFNHIKDLMVSIFKRLIRIVRCMAGFIWLLGEKIYKSSLRHYPSYSQAGEDIIVNALFKSFGIMRFSYLDVGANHPDFISNTYLFYKQGCRGVCVEPNSKLYKTHRRVRPGDICLNVGIGVNDLREAEFYLFTGLADGLSTFSKKDADHWANVGMKGVGRFKPAKIVKLPLMPINEIISTTGIPDFLSIDVEGMDLLVLKTLDFSNYMIKCICVETVYYSQDGQSLRNTELMGFMNASGYSVYADTGINTIYVNTQWFKECQARFEALD